jgi:hypothetical protein
MPPQLLRLNLGKAIANQTSERLAWLTISKKFKEWAVKHLHQLHEKEKSLQDDVTHRAIYRAMISMESSMSPSLVRDYIILH